MQLPMKRVERQVTDGLKYARAHAFKCQYELFHLKVLTKNF